MGMGPIAIWSAGVGASSDLASELTKALNAKAMSVVSTSPKRAMVPSRRLIDSFPSKLKKTQKNIKVATVRSGTVVGRSHKHDVGYFTVDLYSPIVSLSDRCDGAHVSNFDSGTSERLLGNVYTLSNGQSVISPVACLERPSEGSTRARDQREQEDCPASRLLPVHSYTLWVTMRLSRIVLGN